MTDHAFWGCVLSSQVWFAAFCVSPTLSAAVSGVTFLILAGAVLIAQRRGA